MERAERSAATVWKVSRIAYSLASRCAPVNDFLPGRDIGDGVCPDKADMFSGNQSHEGKSQKPWSTGRICGGNEADEADRQSHLRDGERVTGPQRK